MTLMYDLGMILLGEIRCWSLLRVKGLINLFIIYPLQQFKNFFWFLKSIFWFFFTLWVDQKYSKYKQRKSFIGSKVLTRNKNNLKQRFRDTKALVVLKIKNLSEEPHSWLSDYAIRLFNFFRGRENGYILVMIKTRSCKFNQFLFLLLSENEFWLRDSSVSR